MLIVFASNYMNHHQLPFSKAIMKQKDVEYVFVAFSPVPKARLDFGYSDMNKEYEFVLCAYESDENRKRAEELIYKADIAIFGLSLNYLLKKRAKNGKVSFKFSERLFKQGTDIIHLPVNIARVIKHLKPIEKLPVYFCCNSAYTAADINKYTNFKGKTYKFGYFPEHKKYNLDNLMKNKISNTTIGLKHHIVSILWVARLIGWKHPESAITLAKSLKEKGYNFKLSIIGNGEMEQNLQQMIIDYHLSDVVEMLGSMSPIKVREHMEKVDIFLFTSDFNEGWGAVLNEAMNSACAVVASHAIGSVPFLINNNENGLIYENGNQNMLESQVIKLIKDKKYRNKLAENAYHTIDSLWNAEIAAERFVCLAKNILMHDDTNTPFISGPCSEAEILKDNWYKAE